MAESLYIPEAATKAEKYEVILPQIEALVGGEEDITANLANISAVLRESFGFFWVGFYLVKGEQLVLGPFQGPIACTRINFGKGVCGAVWKEGKTQLVPDVEAFPGHIACSSASKSEIVLPAFKNEKVALVLDIDSDKLNDFDEEDAQHLEKLMRIIENFL
ncbi:GAF domain-containing protein [Litoribacter ruber]|uniref:GAF domain-containing protein n=1 Tax=Litoribacter ruber TaxID=702568 RepID=A0AAP2G4P0_9BACT|nr:MULTISPECIES: GAF domain-containing protein [Litoribacter]MBS9523658.1 GAF domain-containing protein [Litoribacter alkaliphilus]MBT0812172.1 GAF domain-containing protein [Litoribacter ruber]